MERPAPPASAFTWIIHLSRRSEPEREREVISQHGQHAALYVLRNKGAARKFLSRIDVRRTPADDS
jgi:hypothetical protein